MLAYHKHQAVDCGSSQAVEMTVPRRRWGPLKGNTKDFICPEGSWSLGKSEFWACPGPEGSHGASRAMPSLTRARPHHPAREHRQPDPEKRGRVAAPVGTHRALMN